MLPLLTLAADACGLVMGWFAQTLVEPLSFHQFINSGFKGADFQRFSAADIQDRCVWPDHRADRVLSGNAHTRRRRGRGPRGHELGGLASLFVILADVVLVKFILVSSLNRTD
jgi:hypothetical protein